MTSLGRFADVVCQLLCQENDRAAIEGLHEIRNDLLGERQPEELYEKILDAAVSIMRSDFASIQMYRPERGELRLLAHRGFPAEAAKFWKRVTVESGTCCGVALASAKRVIIADIEENAQLVSNSLEIFRLAGIRAVQSTPLISYGGHILGMISTHWCQPHVSQEQDLHYLDILARQFAVLIERSIAEQRTKALLREVSHRAKNILAIVQGVVRQTATQKDPDNFAQDLYARLDGLARSHDLVVASDWQGVQVSELIRSQVAHLLDLGGKRITFDGPPVRIGPRAAQVLGMAVHELATNALKFGSLSGIDGMAAVQSSISEEGEPRFMMGWHERGGTPVVPPQRQGFGQTAMVQMVEYSFDADVSLNYDPGGVT
jgi:two-component sensor histidine kinase